MQCVKGESGVIILTRCFGKTTLLKLFLSIANDYFMQKGIAAFKQDAGPVNFNTARTMAKCCVYTNKILVMLAKKAVNKSMLIDDWIFTVRRYLMEVETDDD